jgi:hypothetical protein
MIVSSVIGPLLGAIGGAALTMVTNKYWHFINGDTGPTGAAGASGVGQTGATGNALWSVTTSASVTGSTWLASQQYFLSFNPYAIGATQGNIGTLCKHRVLNMQKK